MAKCHGHHMLSVLRFQLFLEAVDIPVDRVVGNVERTRDLVRCHAVGKERHDFHLATGELGIQSGRGLERRRVAGDLQQSPENALGGRVEQSDLGRR